jgi:cytochrome c peroxidase
MLKRRTAMLGVLLLSAGTVVLADSGFLPNLFPFEDPTGILKTFSTTGTVDLTGPFFQSLGTNGRSCGTCHQASDAWTVSAAHVADRFEATNGLDPIFRQNDGSNCDNLDTSTVDARRQAYSLLISRGLIRISLPIPTGAEFDVVSVSNPYGCNDTTTLSMYRRPLPATNLRFLSTVMWDGRESSTQTGTTPITSSNYPGSLQSDLMHQSVDATLGHAQATTPPNTQQQQQIVAFEMALSTAQAIDSVAETLSADGATGGPVTLVSQPFFIGINDPLGQGPPNTPPFTPVIFTLFTQSWVQAASKPETVERRASILRGQTLFNSRPIIIDGVAGINDVLGKPLQGTCGTCHDTFNVGNHSVSAPLNIGVADLTNPLGVSYLPVITLRQKADPTKEISTTDPGRALVTGKWADIGKVKGPILRGLAARAPYFHNGAAAGLKEVIQFYNVRFSMGLTDAEQADLVAFLSVL